MNLRKRLYGPATRVLPAGFFEKRQARWALEAFRRERVVFIHVPRTAGMSVVRTVYRSRVRHFSIAQFLTVADSDLRRLPRFTIVRNPWDRAVSAFLFAKQGGIPGGAQMLNAQRYRGPDFATFDTFVQSFLAVRDVWRLDHVFRPQVYYTGTAPHAEIDHVGRFDDLRSTENWLSGVLGRPVELIRSNATRHDPYRTYYSDRTRRLIAGIYRDDIDQFGFRF